MYHHTFRMRWRIIHNWPLSCSQTASWVLVEENVSVSTAGEAYLVAWNPDGMTGKLWIATGTVEDFGPDDWDNFGMWLERVRTHHEVEGFEPAEPPEEQDCDDESDAGPNQTGPKSTRCSAITDMPSPWALSLIALMSWRRRRPRGDQPYMLAVIACKRLQAA